MAYFEYSSTISASLMSAGRSAIRHRLEHATELVGVDFDPRRRQVHLLGHGQRFLDAQLRLGLLDSAMASPALTA